MRGLQFCLRMDDGQTGSNAQDGLSTRLVGRRRLGNLIFTGPSLETLPPGPFTPVLVRPSQSFSMIN